MGKLEEKLRAYESSDYYRFHMPGHKGQPNSEQYKLDITEIDGFDNLHYAEGILQEIMHDAEKYYGTEKTYYLVNGATCGILSAISAVGREGDRILTARNSHKSVFNAIYVNKLKNSYIYPQIVDKVWINGGIYAKNVEKALNSQTNIKAVFITSPTYEGIVSDIKAIADVVHKYNIPLIVDEAHGAHFSMGEGFPVSAIECGADVVIQSLHKTMASMTQTALLHICRGSLINREKIERYLSIYQTSSPSYVLMSSMDNCINDIINDNGSRFLEYNKKLDDFYKEADGLKKLKVINNSIVGEYGIYDRDKGKIVISTHESGKDGKWLYDVLRKKYHLQPEMVAGSYVICMTSYMDTEEGFNRLGNALKEIDTKLIKEDENNSYGNEMVLSCKETIICKTIYEAVESDDIQIVELRNATGRVSTEFVYAYPPGIPIIVPGEVITKEIIDDIINGKENGLNIEGLGDMNLDFIKVLNIPRYTDNRKVQYK